MNFCLVTAVPAVSPITLWSAKSRLAHLPHVPCLPGEGRKMKCRFLSTAADGIKVSRIIRSLCTCHVGAYLTRCLPACHNRGLLVAPSSLGTSGFFSYTESRVHVFDLSWFHFCAQMLWVVGLQFHQTSEWLSSLRLSDFVCSWCVFCITI